VSQPSRVLGRVVALAEACDGDVGDGDEVIPEWRADEAEVAYAAAMQACRAEADRPQDQIVLCIQVTPDPPVPIERSATVDVHVPPTQLEECGGVLIHLLEGTLALEAE
ncbi:MAG: hypothetical protein LQ340_003593, partial [Diploschistes diacapsis]